MNKKQNKLLGVAWLKFFCFWRPWISFAFAIMMIINLIEYEEYRIYYLSNFWGYLLIGSTFANVVLLIILFFMAKKKDSRTIDLISWVLMLEVAGFAYSGALQTAISISYFFVLFIILCIIYYFIWYKTNMKYFNKREFWFNITSNLVKEEYDEIEDEYEEVKEEQKDIKEKIIVEEKRENKKVVAKVQYCKFCGGKIDANKQCTKCGKQYFKLPKNILLYFIIVILVLSNLIFVLLYDDAKKEIENIYDNMDIQSIVDEELDDMLNGKTIYYLKNKVNFYDDNIVFVVEGYENFAYRYDCLDKEIEEDEYSFAAFNTEQALAKGFKIISCD